jgi:hypothetical protein
MTATDVLNFSRKYPDGTSDWQRDNNWMRVKVDKLIDATHANNGKFIWSIGGWYDLQQTISKDQVDAFVHNVVQLLKKSGDGVDLSWEHISQLANGKPNPNAKLQLEILAETLMKLRVELDKSGLKDKEIGYTTRFNAFMHDSRNYGFRENFASDGEGLSVDDWLISHGSSLNMVVNWVNIMAYNVGPAKMPNSQTWNITLYKDILKTFSSRIDKNLIVLGFEPGGQYEGGSWEGMAIEKNAINYVAHNNFGGSMFWAINQPPLDSTENTGRNSNVLAQYSKSLFKIK